MNKLIAVVISFSFGSGIGYIISDVFDKETRPLKYVEVTPYELGGVPVKLLMDIEYPSSNWISNVSSKSEDEMLIDNLVSVYQQANNLAGFQELWADDDLSELKDILSGEGTLNKNKKYYMGVLDSKVLAVWKYGFYKMVFVKHKFNDDTELVKSYPFFLVADNQYRLSNKLGRDSFYQYFRDNLQVKLVPVAE